MAYGLPGGSPVAGGVGTMFGGPLGGLLAQGAGGILGALFGAHQSHQAQKKEREYRANLMRIADPAYMRQLQQSLYNQGIASPAFTQATRGIFNAGSNITNHLAGSLAARGLTNSGVGAIAPALAGSSTAGQMGNLRTGLYNAAGSQAAGQQAQQLASLQSMGPEHTFNYGSQAFGGSLADIGKFLTDYYMRSKFPNTFANAGAS